MSPGLSPWSYRTSEIINNQDYMNTLVPGTGIEPVLPLRGTGF
jgi:hypothetical protein